jgi:hypothetical protein
MFQNDLMEIREEEEELPQPPRVEDPVEDVWDKHVSKYEARSE